MGVGARTCPHRGNDVTASAAPRHLPAKRTLLVSRDVLGEKMAGPGIRYYHLSRILSRHTALTLAIPSQQDQDRALLQARLPGVSIIEYSLEQWSTVNDVAESADTIIISPYLASELPQFATMPAALVIDGYDPLLTEWLATLPEDNLEEQLAHWHSRSKQLFSQYLHGDFFICASERQRYWWLGQLEVAGRINPRTFQEDPSLRNLVDVVPYGLPEEPPRHTRQVVKGVWPGIGPDDTLLLWGGGLWSWLDPVTAVRAIARLHADYPHLKLIFPGTVHPNPEIGQGMPVRNSEIYSLAEEEGLLDKAVFFGEWMPYVDWPNVLLESDIALSLHHDTVETQLAFRSRILEYIWAGIPIIATRGDTTGELVRSYQLGEVVEYEDVAAVADAILDLVHQGPSNYQQRLASARNELTWERTAQPLIQFCQNPRRAVDRQGDYASGVPYYERRVQRLEQEKRQLEQLVRGYESGKVMRLLNRLQTLRRQWLPARNR